MSDDERDDVDSDPEIELDEIDQNDDDDDLNTENGDDEEDDMTFGPLTAINLKDEKHIIIKVCHPDERITSHIITLSEATEATGIRASQIENGSAPFTDTTGLKSPVAMAHKEFLDRKNPLILERLVEIRGNVHYVEHWKVREMTYIHV